MPKLTPVDEPEFPWDRGANESDVAHAAFTVYRGQSPLERSIREVARTLGKSATLIGGWSSRHQWVRRVAAWDRHLDRIKLERAAAAVGEMAERHIQLAIGMQSKALEKLLTLDINAMSVADLDRFVRTATMVEREARGILTGRVEDDPDAEGRGADLDERITELVSKRQRAIDVRSVEIPEAEEA